MPVDVEVSIVNHANRDLVRACLASLPAACQGIEARVTVIDNDSRDGSLEMLAREFPDVHVIANPRRMGFGANHNQVLERVVRDRSARMVLVLNDDTVLEPSSITRLVRALDSDPSLGAVAPAVRNPDGRTLPGRFTYPTFRWSLRIVRGAAGGERPDPEGWLQGACLLLRTEAIADVGAYDTRFFLFFEDCDLSGRLQAAGWGLATVDDAQITHLAHRSVLREDFAAFTAKQGLRSRYLYFAKHAGPVRSLALATGSRLIFGARGLAALVRPRRVPAPRGALARHFLALARYNPRRPLPPELAGNAPPSDV